MAKARDLHYKDVGMSVSQGRYTHLNEIFNILPKSVVAKDLGIRYNLFDKKINELEPFRFKDIVGLAALLEVDNTAIFALINNQYIASQKQKLKKKSLKT